MHIQMHYLLFSLVFNSGGADILLNLCGEVIHVTNLSHFVVFVCISDNANDAAFCHSVAETTVTSVSSDIICIPA